MIEALEDMTCQALVEVVTEYLEGTLPALEHQRFESHLDGCDGCAAYVDQMRLTIQLLGHFAVEDIPAEEQARLIELFRNWRSAGTRSPKP
jgi:anti-sigma factor RsiW